MDLLEALDEQFAAADVWPSLAPTAVPPRALPEPRCVAQALEQLPAVLRDALVAAGATAPGTLRGLCDGSPSDAGLGRLVDDAV